MCNRYVATRLQLQLLVDDQRLMEYMSVTEVGQWLTEKGFPHEIVEAFIDQEIDGTALIQTFTMSPGPDCLKSVISKFGLRVKVYTTIKSQLEAETKQADEGSREVLKASGQTSTGSTEIFDDEESLVHDEPAKVSSDQPSTTDVDSPLTSKNKQTPMKKPFTPSKGSTVVPVNFPIPVFRPSTEENLANKKIADDDRKYIVRVLATMLLSYVQRPRMDDCDIVARSLLRKFSFLKESNSWKQFLYTRTQNLNRPKKNSSASDSPQHKRRKVESTTKHFYAALESSIDDQVSIERNVDQLKREVMKTKPRVEVVKELVKRTLKSRREAILSGGRPDALIEEYPHLKKANYLMYEFDLIVNMDDVYQVFLENWEKWKFAIVKYSCANQSTPMQLKKALQDLVSYDSDSESLAALRCLSYFFVTKSNKKKSLSSSNCVIPHFLMEGVVGTPVQDLVDGDTNQPHIVMLVDDDPPAQYFIAVEQIAQVKVNNIAKGVFVAFAMHYIYDMQYNPRLKDFFFFIENILCGIPNPSCKPSPLYSNITAAIECYLEESD